MELPIELWQVILEESYFIEQINLTMVSKYFNQNLKIYDFLCNNVEEYSYLYDYRKIKKKITDDILKRYPDIRFLDLIGAKKVTDEGMKHLNLHTLITNEGITDDGIKHMTNMRELSIFCSGITDKGIEKMNLCRLDMEGNCDITDDGIKNMTNMKYLIAYKTNISDEGIKNMRLEHLHTKSNITSKGLLHMNNTLKWLYIENCEDFYAEDVLQLKLDYLEMNSDDYYLGHVMEHPDMQVYLDNLTSFVCEADWGRN